MEPLFISGGTLEIRTNFYESLAKIKQRGRKIFTRKNSVGTLIALNDLT